jgi:hypothetical protein
MPLRIGSYAHFENKFIRELSYAISKVEHAHAKNQIKVYYVSGGELWHLINCRELSKLK